MSVKLSHQYAPDRRCLLHNGISLIAVFALWIIGVAGEAHAQQQSQNQPQASGGKPNILVIFGDDIGHANVSAYGYNQLPYLTGKEPHSARKEFIYFNDDGDLVALRYENWKLVFEEQRSPGTLEVWAEPFTKLRVHEDVRPARRPIRAGGHHVEHLLGLAHGSRLHRLRRAGLRREVPRDLQGLPAEPARRDLHHRPGDGQAETESWRLSAASSCWRRCRRGPQISL